MNRYKFLYFIWLIPAFLLFLLLQQALVYYSLQDTYKNGKSYVAHVVDFSYKQIGAQTNSYIVLRFQPKDESQVQRKLSLPVEMVSRVAKMNVVPVRYKKNAFEEIVLMPAYDIQRGVVLMNIFIAVAGFIMAFLLALFVHRYANRKRAGEEQELVIERVD